MPRVIQEGSSEFKRLDERMGNPNHVALLIRMLLSGELPSAEITEVEPNVLNLKQNDTEYEIRIKTVR